MKNMLMLLVVAVLFAVPASAYDWHRANTSIPAGPVWVANQAATVTDQDTYTLVLSDSMYFNATTGESQRFVTGDTQTVFGDTYYPTAGVAIVTDMAGYYKFTVDAPLDSAIVVNFTRVPRDITDGDYIAAGASRTYDLKVNAVFVRTSNGAAGNAHPSCVRVRKYK